MKRNIDELLKEKYKEIEYNNNVELEIKNIKRNNNLYKVASIVLLIIAVGITSIIYNPGQELVADNNDIHENINSEGEQELNTVVPDYQIVIDSKDIIPYASYATAGIKVKYVLAIRVNKILGYTNYSEKQDKYSFPVTKFEAEVLKCFKGEIKENVEIYTLGGIVSLADWEKTLSEEQKEKMGYNKMTQEYKENTYVEVANSLTMDSAKPESGKVYLVCLNQDTNMYDGLITAGVFAMREYDMSTNSIKENGEWIEVTDVKILDEVIKYKP